MFIYISFKNNFRHIKQHKNETEGKKFPMKKSTNETNVKNLETDEKASNSSAAHETPLDSDTLDITNIRVKEIFIPVKNILAKENVKEAKSIKRKRKYINNFCRPDCEICNRPNCKNCTVNNDYKIFNIFI